MSAAQPRVVEAAPRGEGHIGTSRVTREAVRVKYSSAARGGTAARRAPRGINPAPFPQGKEGGVKTPPPFFGGGACPAGRFGLGQGDRHSNPDFKTPTG